MGAAPDDTSRMSRALDRLRRQIGWRGWLAGIACTLGPALLWRLRVHLLAIYRRRCDHDADLEGSEGGERVTTFEGLSGEDRLALRTHRGDGVLAMFERRFARGEWLAVSRENGALACSCWVHEARDYPPGAKGPVAILLDVFTLSPYRGRGHLARAIDFAARRLAQDRPDLPVFIETSIENHSARRGFEKAGFECVGLRLTGPRLNLWFPRRPW